MTSEEEAARWDSKKKGGQEGSPIEGQGNQATPGKEYATCRIGASREEVVRWDLKKTKGQEGDPTGGQGCQATPRKDHEGGQIGASEEEAERWDHKERGGQEGGSTGQEGQTTPRRKYKTREIRPSEERAEGARNRGETPESYEECPAGDEKHETKSTAGYPRERQVEAAGLEEDKEKQPDRDERRHRDIG